MGYESKIYIVEKSSIKLASETKIYAQVIAMFDLCKMGSSDGFYKLFDKETDCYFYADDGNTQVLKDRYGDSLIECDIVKLKEWLKERIKNNNYRRLKPFYNLIKSFNKKDWENLAIIHYGY